MAKFVPRQRKHKVLARQKAQENAQHEVDDTNQEILPGGTKDREARKALMKKELVQEGVKMSGKKAKRLEKYLDTMLRKDENKVLLAQLASRKIDTSLFSSSRSLGQGRETKKQAISRALREEKAGLEGQEERTELLYETRREAPEGDDDNDDDNDNEEEKEKEEDKHLPNTGFNIIQQISKWADSSSAEGVFWLKGVAGAGKTIISRTLAECVEQELLDPVDDKHLSQATKEDKNKILGAKHSTPPVGSGLKRPLETDEDGRPIIKKRQKRGGLKTKISLQKEPSKISDDEEDDEDDEDDEDEWNGFGSDGQNSDSDTGDEAGSAKDEENDENEDEEEDGKETSDDESSDEESEEDEDDAAEQRGQRSSAFKSWANQQRNEALGYTPGENSTTNLVIPKPENFTPRAPEQDPLPAELKPTENATRKAHSITVARTPEIQEARLKLPVVSEEQRLMEAIHNNDIVVICGATGSGKTTQVPQFLYEAGYGAPNSPTPGMIGVTQPRRVAAVSMSRRVAEELGDHSEAVGYQIRFEGTTSSKTAIKFLTDGVLLREIAQDFALRKYSAIIIDEAHERSVNTDILIGMLSRVIKLRAELSTEDETVKPLKLIVMSATLRIEDMTMNKTLFDTPPRVLEVEGRQHPVSMHFSRRTSHDYVEEAFKKISRGHKKLPPGGFLVFLTGRNEIIQLSKRLKAAFGGGMKTAEGPKVQISATEAPVEVEDLEFGDVDEMDGDDLGGIPSDEDELEEEEDEEFNIEDDQQMAPLKMEVLPLYSLLSTKEQLRVFEPTPEGTRRIILATNVAETSLTIPGTRFVFDSGRVKERRYDRRTGVQSYEIGWISKASASQRAGRAGRTGPGHCYRLYSSAVFERDFAQFADPELLRMPIEGIVLQLKAMNLQHVVNFPFPTPPNRESLAKAEKLLTYLSALSTEGQVTQIGLTMSVFPLSPRFAKILLVGHLHDCLPYTIALVAGLSVADVFLPENTAVPSLAADGEAEIRTQAVVIAEDRQAKARKMFNQAHRNFCFLDDKSDAIKLLQVVGEFAHEPTEGWCESHFVRYKVLKEIQQLRRQITELLRNNIASFKNLRFQDKLDPPTPKQVQALKQMVASGFVDQVAIRADLAPIPPEQYRKPKRAIDIPYLPLLPLSAGYAPDSDPCVYIHPTSPLAHISTQEAPEYIVYSYLQRATSSGLDQETGKKPKTRMHALTDVTGGQLAGLAKGTPLLSYGKPIKEIKPAAASGTNGETYRECWVVPYLRAENTGGQGWPLPAKKTKQRKVPGKGWVVE